MVDEENKDEMDQEEDKEGLLGFSPELGQRVHFAEGTNLRCREDKKSPTDDDSEERLANRGGPAILSRRFSSDETRADANGGVNGECYEIETCADLCV